MSIQCSTATPSSATATSSTRRTDTTVGVLAALVSLFLIGSAAPVAATLRQTPLLAGQGVRYSISALTLIIVLRLTGRLSAIRPRLKDLPRIGILGVVGIAGFNVSFVGATRYADPALVGSILAATPVLLALLGPVLQRRRPAAGVLLGAVTVAAGTALATGSGTTTGPGLVLSLVALGCEVGFTLLALPLIRTYGSLATTTLAVTAGAILLLVVAVPVEGAGSVLDAVAHPHDLLVLIFLALAVSIGANFGWYTALPRLGADRAGLFYALSPIGALTTALLLGTSAPGAGELAGLALVIIGLLVGLNASRADVAPDRPQS